MNTVFGSLFAGIGGFDLGFERTGMTCAWQVETAIKCNEVLAHHWPDVRRYGDVRDVGRHDLESVDFICGGFPCQGLSVAGRRTGLADERSGLWWEFHRVIEELRPRWVIVENVPGLLSSNRGRDMAAIVGALAELGYGWAYRMLDAQYFGVAQRRRRVFIVGCLGDRTSAAKVLFESESLRRDIAPRREAGAEAARSVVACLNGGGNDGGFRTEPGEHMIVQHALSGHNQRNDPDGECFIVEAYQCHGNNVGPMGTLRQGSGSVGGGVPFLARPLARGQTTNHYDESQQTYVPVAFDWQSGGDVRLNISEKHTSALQASQVPAVSNIYPTLRGQPNQGPGCMADDAAMAGMVRRLTPTECERLQGFPDDWTAINGMKDTPRYRMLGNAVCVPVAAWIGRRIMLTEEIR